MKMVFLSKAVRKYPWECSTARFVTEYFGLRLKPYQKLMLHMMDLRDHFDKRFRPRTYYWRSITGPRGLRSNLLICDDLCDKQIDK